MNQQSVYYSDSYLNNCIRARQFELEGKWDEARQLRVALGHTDDVKAIDAIIEATRLGDKFRSLTAGLNQLWEDRVINNSQYHEKLQEASREVYGK